MDNLLLMSSFSMSTIHSNSVINATCMTNKFSYFSAVDLLLQIYLILGIPMSILLLRKL
jgi:hypothetical protein